MNAKPPSNGACVGKPVQWWFPDLVTRNPREIRMQMKANADKALAICDSCPVLTECKDYALEWELHGIWGGMTERERKEYRSAHNIPYRRPTPVTILGYYADA